MSKDVPPVCERVVYKTLNLGALVLFICARDYLIERIIDVWRISERMEKQVKKLDSFAPEDGHIESVLVGVQKLKVSFQDWRGKQLVILFHDVEEFHGMDSEWQCILNQDISEFTTRELENDINEYWFVGAWDENAFLKIRGKSMEIYEVGVSKSIETALFEVGLDYIGEQLPEMD